MIAYKQPSEVRPLAVDFSALLAENETILQTSTVTIYDPEENEVTNSMLNDIDWTDSMVKAIIQGGEHLKDYKVTFTALTSLGMRNEEDVTLKVREQ